MLDPGAILAAYEVKRRLAVGGMGEVYLARHRLLDRLDAVKVLRPHLAADPSFRQRFLREALSAAKLRHPHVVSIYTADEANGLLYLAMEYVEGADLANVLHQEKVLTPERTVGLLRPVADALDTAHSLRLVHRDIKPSNLLVTRPGTSEESVVLVDFGISKQFDSDNEITRTGEVVGTVAYCAPEQLSESGVDGRVDQYALACVAYQCLTGEVPFPRESQIAIMTAHMTAPPPSALAVRPDLPPAVDPVLARAMSKRPDERYRTCAEFVAALTAAVAAGPGGPRPATQTARPATQQSGSGEPYRPGTITGRAPVPVAKPVLAVIGGPDAGQVLALVDGDQKIEPGPGYVVEIQVIGDAVWLRGDGRPRVNGEPARGNISLSLGDLVEVGPYLLQVRASAELAALGGQNGGCPDAVTVGQIAENGLSAPLRQRRHPYTLYLRIGWRMGRPPVPIVIPLAVDVPFAVRGTAEVTAGFVRWLIAQSVVLHTDRDLCLVAAVQPSTVENWLWVGYLPHARPRTPPISGAHVATTRPVAADLMTRLRELVTMRRSIGEVARDIDHIRYPRVLAVLDERLGVAPGGLAGEGAGRLGVHAVHLLDSQTPVPSGLPCLDLAADGRSCRLNLPGVSPLVGVPDTVTSGYFSSLVNALPDD